MLFRSARNWITNNWLEALVMSAGGPGAAVGNFFRTLPYTASTRALCLDNGPYAMWGTNRNFPELTYSFVGNLVLGGRSAVDNVPSDLTGTNPLAKLHICGNQVTVNAPWEAVYAHWDLANGGGVANLVNCSGLNLAGNTFSGFGSACQNYYGGGIAEIINNDFCGATNIPACTVCASDGWLGLFKYYDPTNSFWTYAYEFEDIISLQTDVVGQLIAGNKLRLNQGGRHLLVNDANSPARYFLLKNSFFDSTQTTATTPVIGPSGSAAPAQAIGVNLPTNMPSGYSVYLQY